MISILIPVYNFDVTQLVSDLQKQANQLTIPIEILVFDDGSTADFKQKNRSIQTYPIVNYKELLHNLGRSAIRNALTKVANFPYLLFMDGDSKVVRVDYLKKYQEYLAENTLLYGGRVYSNQPPKDKQLLLHYFYGKNREEILSEERKTTSYHSFMTNNFLISKSLALEIPFEEKIDGYGHEDTLFGGELKRRGVPINHLDNALEHIGLETTEVFLRKQQQAIKNLYQLTQNGQPIETKLLRTFVTLKKWRLTTLIFYLLSILYPFLKKQLYQSKPVLFYLDLFKLFHFLQLVHEEQSEH